MCRATGQASVVVQTLRPTEGIDYDVHSHSLIEMECAMTN